MAGLKPRRSHLGLAMKPRCNDNGASVPYTEERFLDESPRLD